MAGPSRVRQLLTLLILFTWLTWLSWKNVASFLCYLPDPLSVRRCLIRPVMAGQSPAPPAAHAKGTDSPALQIHPPSVWAARWSQLFTYVNNCVQFWCCLCMCSLKPTCYRACRYNPDILWFCGEEMWQTFPSNLHKALIWQVQQTGVTGCIVARW